MGVIDSTVISQLSFISNYLIDQGSRKRMKVMGAENQIQSICSEIPKSSLVAMDFSGCKTVFLGRVGAAAPTLTRPLQMPISIDFNKKQKISIQICYQ